MAAGTGPTLGQDAALAAYAEAAKALGIAEAGEKPGVSEAAVRFSEWATNVGWVRTVRSGHIVVEVDANSGEIRRIMNEVAWLKSDSRAESRLKECKGFAPTRSPKEAIDAAEKFCLALGQRPARDVRLRVIKFDEKRGCWELGWARYIGEYLFDEEGIGITIDDQTGDLLVYNNHVTKITCGTEVRVPKDKARAIARDQVSRILPALVHNQSFEFEEDQEPKLCIVYQNDAMRRLELMTDLMRRFKTMPPPPDQLPPPPEQLPPRARLVYAIRFGFWYVGKEGTHIDRGPVTVWVDAASGEVVGGIT
jgi:hypothetical protein